MVRRAGRSKYGVDNSDNGKTKRTYGGRTYRSVAETQYAFLLDLERRAGTVLSWGYEAKSFPLHGSTGVKVGDFIPDFEVVMPDWSVEYREVKGKEVPLWTFKHKLFLLEYPDVKHIILDAIWDRKSGMYSFVRRPEKRPKRARAARKTGTIGRG